MVSSAQAVHVVECSTYLGLATALALLPPLAEEGRRRVLLVTANARYPEVDHWYHRVPALSRELRAHFHEVVDLNEAIRPTHPHRWRVVTPPQANALREAFGGPVELLTLESLAAAPSRTLALAEGQAEIEIYIDGLMGYSPTRRELPAPLLRRVRRVYYPDYLPELQPLVLRETGATLHRLPMESLRAGFEAFAGSWSPEGDTRGGEEAWFLGQNLADVEALSAEGELALYERGLALLNERFAPEAIAFKPHPAASVSATRQLALRFEGRTGVPLRLLSVREPLELAVRRRRPALVASAFSTGLVTLARLQGIPACSFGAGELLRTLYPLQNSNRIPLLIAAEGLPSLEQLWERWDGKPSELPVVHGALEAELRTREPSLRALQVAVAYAMQPKCLADLKGEAQDAASCIPALAELLGASGAASVALASPGRWVARVCEDSRHQRWGDWVEAGLAVALGRPRARKLRWAPEAFLADLRQPRLRRWFTGR